MSSTLPHDTLPAFHPFTFCLSQLSPRHPAKEWRTSTAHHQEGAPTIKEERRAHYQGGVAITRAPIPSTPPKITITIVSSLIQCSVSSLYFISLIHHLSYLKVLFHVSCIFYSPYFFLFC